jgi:hypothetical protein
MERMHVSRRVTVRDKRWLPPWAFNDEQLKKVLMYRGWTYVHGGSMIPPDMTFDKIEQQVNEHFERSQSFGFSKDNREQFALHEKHVAAVKASGGYMQFMTAVVYRSLRLGRDSVAVALDTGITPWAVRQIIVRVNEAAVELGFETFEASKSRRRSFEGIRLKGEQKRDRAAKLATAQKPKDKHIDTH